ncbi:MAG TPA: 2-octaprenylphenol hydroxylase, partial [Clostridiales bacterium]|nr:2-octaprenylphenol hydroxylase [Clostridiales bacterium]
KEGENADRFRRNFQGRPKIAVPAVRWIYTTGRVLTMECIEGMRINQTDQLASAGIDRTELGTRLARDLLRQILQDGFFHADPHPGNLLVQPDGTIYYLDLGMVGRLSETCQRTLSSLFTGMALQDSHQVATAVAELDLSRQMGSMRRFELEISRLMDQYLGLPISQIQVGSLLAQTFQVAFHYHIQIPGEMTLLAKALITLQGVVESLDPELNLLEIMRPMTRQLLIKSFSPQAIGKDLHRSLTDYHTLLRQLPTILLELMQKLQDNDFNLRFELKDISKVQRHFDRIFNRLSIGLILLAVSIIIAGVIIGSSLNAASGPEMYELSLAVLRAGLIIAAVILGGLVISMIRSKRF